MDVGLGPLGRAVYVRTSEVLILVLVDVGLGPQDVAKARPMTAS